MRSRVPLTFALLLAALPATALEGWEAALAPPEGARVLLDSPAELQRALVPVRPATADAAPSDLVEGLARVRSHALDGGDAPLAEARRMRAALEAAGFETILDCAARACGGFAFLSQIDVAPPPEMLVNLADFHQLTLRRAGGAGEAIVSALFSRMGARLHAQIVRIDVIAAPPPPAPRPGAALAPEGAATSPDATTEASSEAPALRLGALLDARGHAPLDGLAFLTGSTELDSSAAPVLDAAAAALAARPELAVAVVGHTDASGGLAANLDVSRARAEAVRAALVSRGIAPERLTAEGAGWLAPRASNAHEAGRAANRRVELVAR